MKIRSNYARLLKIGVISAISLSIYAFGYSNGSTSKVLQDNTLTVEKAKTLVANYQEGAPTVNGKIDAVFISKKLLEDVNALLSIKRNADGVRIYFGEDKDANTANLVVGVNGNADDTSFILKSTGPVGTCPTSCDSRSALQSE
jgi:hypothetical protein